MKPPRQAIRLTEAAVLDRLPRLLEAVSEVCDAAGADPATRHDLRLAVEEACVNVMRHAYRDSGPGDLTLDVARIEWQGAPAMRVIVQDHGLAFDPLAQAPPIPAASGEPLRIGGLGVHLMKQVTDAQDYHRDATTGNNLTLVKLLKPRLGEEE